MAVVAIERPEVLASATNPEVDDHRLGSGSESLGKAIGSIAGNE